MTKIKVDNPIVELDGTLAGPVHGLSIGGSGNHIQGLVINRFGDDAIDVEFNGGNTIVGNFVGTNVTGTVARA